MMQIFVNGIISGSIIALPAIAFTLMFSIMKFPNFAIGAYVTVGGIYNPVFSKMLGLPIAVATVMGWRSPRLSPG